MLRVWLGVWLVYYYYYLMHLTTYPLTSRAHRIALLFPWHHFDTPYNTYRHARPSNHPTIVSLHSIPTWSSSKYPWRMRMPICIKDWKCHRYPMDTSITQHRDWLRKWRYHESISIIWYEWWNGMRKECAIWKIMCLRRSHWLMRRMEECRSREKMMSAWTERHRWRVSSSIVLNGASYRRRDRPDRLTRIAIREIVASV